MVFWSIVVRTGAAGAAAGAAVCVGVWRQSYIGYGGEQ